MSKLEVRINPPVFLGAATIVLFFVGYSLVALESMQAQIKITTDFINSYFSWLYIGGLNFFLLVCVFILFSGFGRIRLGGPNAVPEFSDLSWFAMLFSAGVGIGLLFYGLGEPILHLASPPVEGVQPLSKEAADMGFKISFLHWGVHGWGLYCLVGLALAYFHLNKKLPLTISSAFYPLLGERVRGPVGSLVDMLAVVATLFGVATSLGMGVMQVNAGLSHMFGISDTVGVKIALIGGITLAATISVVSGIGHGIRRLSEITVGLGILLLLFVFVMGPTADITSGLAHSLGGFISDFPQLALSLETSDNKSWMSGWTIFYWGWWIAWSPFVGMFIARISKGRTIRQFVMGVLFVPALFSFVWISVLGRGALGAINGGADHLLTEVQNNLPVGLYKLLELYPFASISCFIALVVVVTFFVTSSDSGSFVIDMITSGGDPNPPVWQRVFWSFMEGAVAAVLLLSGGLGALQAGSIASALPFCLVLIVMVFCLLKALSQDTLEAVPSEKATKRGESPSLS